MEQFGVTIDKDLTFKQHVSSICKKVNNQFSVMTRFGKRGTTNGEIVSILGLTDH